MEREELELEVDVCHQCSLSGRKVLSRGNTKASIMLIGEGPGAEEVRQRRPFTGPSGKELDKALTSIGLTENDVYITNCVLCRPPENRTPTGDELSACRFFLDSQIEMIKPKIIVTLGLIAFHAMTTRTGLMRHVNQPIPSKAFTIFPMLHPAAMLHNPSNREIWNEGWDPKSITSFR